MLQYISLTRTYRTVMIGATAQANFLPGFLNYCFGFDGLMENSDTNYVNPTSVADVLADPDTPAIVALTAEDPPFNLVTGGPSCLSMYSEGGNSIAFSLSRALMSYQFGMLRPNDVTRQNLMTVPIRSFLADGALVSLGDPDSMCFARRPRPAIKARLISDLSSGSGIPGLQRGSGGFPNDSVVAGNGSFIPLQLEIISDWGGIGDCRAFVFNRPTGATPATYNHIAVDWGFDALPLTDDCAAFLADGPNTVAYLKLTYYFEVDINPELLPNGTNTPLAALFKCVATGGNVANLVAPVFGGNDIVVAVEGPNSTEYSGQAIIAKTNQNKLISGSFERPTILTTSGGAGDMTIAQVMQVSCSNGAFLPASLGNASVYLDQTFDSVAG